MNITELAAQLHGGKRREISDLARFISTRTDQNPNYTILLGAGCSISSGIRSANELTKEWRNELCPGIEDTEQQRHYLKQNCGDWYDPNKEYSSLFEKRYDLQRQRRMFVEKEVAGKLPSLGYAYLTALVSQNYLNTIFTTNFDDLINEAFYQYSEQRPIVCAHDSSINSITVTSKRPKIIKLHGDYLFDDLKATTRETESLEQNMKAKFSEFAKDYGLIIVGYSGTDRSIMEVITALLKNDEYFKGGIYWCLRKGSEISEELRKLLWKEKVYFVEIEGFDEMLAELYSCFNKDEALPFSTVSVSRRPTEIANQLLKAKETYPTKSTILKSAYDQLEKQSKRTTLMNMVMRPEKEDNPNDSDTFTDDELITQIEIKDSISSGNYREAISKGRSSIKMDNIRPVAKRRILNLIVDAHKLLGDLNSAISVVDELIALQPFKASNYLRKADLVLDHTKKLAIVINALEINPHYVPSYYKKAAIHENEADSRYGDSRKQAVNAARKELDIGISKDPSLNNPCWGALFDLISKFETDIKVRDAELKSIVDKLSAMNPDAYKVLLMRANMLSDRTSRSEIETLISNIETVKQRSDLYSNAELEEILIDCVAKMNDDQMMKDTISRIESTYDLSHETDLAIKVAWKKRKRLGLDNDAVKLMQACLNHEFHSEVVNCLVNTLIDLDRTKEAEEIFNKWANKLPPYHSYELKVRLLEASKDFDGALNELSNYRSQTGIDGEIANKLFLLLKKGAYVDAEKSGKDFLSAINYNPEAVSEIVNYEIARKKNGSKVSTDRLDSTLRFNPSPQAKAAVYALMNKKKEMYENLKIALEKDKTFRLNMKRWPAFDDVRSDQEFVRMQNMA